MSLAKLQNTTIMSTELTHGRLKYLATKIGVTEDIVSRLALGVSIREGKISEKREDTRRETPEKWEGGERPRENVEGRRDEREEWREKWLCKAMHRARAQRMRSIMSHGGWR